MTQAISTGTFTTAKWIVSSDISQGTHTTIASALTSASSGDTVFIRPGTYTENLTLKAGVNLSAYVCDSETPNVKIVGKATYTTAGTVSISGIYFQDNNDNIFSITGSAASILKLINCYIAVSNNIVGISCSSSGGAKVFLYNCNGDITSSTGTYFGFSAGDIILSNCQFFNTVVSTTASTLSNAASASFNFCRLSCSITTSNTSGLGARNVLFRNGSGNATILTINGTGSNVVDNCLVESGTASAISVGTGAILELTRTNINSSNTNAVTGAGTITYGNLLFSNSSNVMNTTTQTAIYTNLGKYKATGQPAFLAYLNADVTNATGDGTAYTIAFDTEVFDQDSNFNGTTTFTAPVTGKYLFTTNVRFEAYGAANTAFIAITTSNRTYRFMENTLGTYGFPAGASGGYVGSTLADMDAGDTCTVVCTVAGGTKTVTVGGSSVLITSFSGQLIC